MNNDNSQVNTEFTNSDPDKPTNKEEVLLINDQQCPLHKQEPQNLKKCCFVELNEGVSYFNLFTYYLVQFSYVMTFTFLDIYQDFLLKSPEYYNIDPKEKGTVNGDILLFDTLYLVIHY
jgi:hypothetical protein